MMTQALAKVRLVLVGVMLVGLMPTLLASQASAAAGVKIGFSQFCANEGCKLINGPKSEPGAPYHGDPLPFVPQVDNYIDWGNCSDCGGPTQKDAPNLPYTYHFNVPTTCRSLTLRMVMGDWDDTENPADQLTVSLHQVGLTQSVRLLFHRVVTETFSLNGGDFSIHLAVARGHENFYLISGEAKSCATATGIAPPPPSVPPATTTAVPHTIGPPPDITANMPMPSGPQAQYDEAWMLAALFDPLNQPEQTVSDVSHGSYSWLLFNMGWLANGPDQPACWNETVSVFTTASGLGVNLDDLVKATGYISDAALAEDSVEAPEELISDFLTGKAQELPELPSNFVFSIAGNASVTALSSSCGYLP